MSSRPTEEEQRTDLRKNRAQDQQRTPFSTQVHAEVKARARATVRGVAIATQSDYTLAQLTEDALNAYCQRMEKRYNDGQPWPTASRQLRPGARIR